MNRRGFLQSILAAGVAPAFIGSAILMPVRKLWTPPPLIIGADPGVGDWIVWTISRDDGKTWHHWSPRGDVGLLQAEPETIMRSPWMELPASTAKKRMFLVKAASE